MLVQRRAATLARPVRTALGTQGADRTPGAAPRPSSAAMRAPAVRWGPSASQGAASQPASPASVATTSVALPPPSVLRARVPCRPLLVRTRSTARPPSSASPQWECASCNFLPDLSASSSVPPNPSLPRCSGVGPRPPSCPTTTKESPLRSLPTWIPMARPTWSSARPVPRS